MYEAVIAATLLGIPVVSWVVVVLLAAVLAWGIVLIVRYERELRGKVRRKPKKHSVPELQQTASDTVEQPIDVADVVSDDELPVSVDSDEQAEVEELTVADELDEELDEQPIDEPRAVEVAVDEVAAEQQPVDVVVEDIAEEPVVEAPPEIEPDEQLESAEADELPEEVEVAQEIADTIDDNAEVTEQVDDEQTEAVLADESEAIEQEVAVSEYVASDEQSEEVIENVEVEQEVVADELVQDVDNEVDAAFTVSAEDELDEQQMDVADVVSDDELPVSVDSDEQAEVEELTVADELDEELGEQPIDEAQAVEAAVDEVVADEQPVDVVVEDIAEDSVVEVQPEVEPDEQLESEEADELPEEVDVAQEVADVIDDNAEATEQVDDEQTEAVLADEPEAIEQEVAEQADEVLPESDIDLEANEVTAAVAELSIDEPADVETIAAEAEPIDEQSVDEPTEPADIASTDDDIDDDADVDGADSDEAMSGELVFADKTIFVRYSKSFTAKLMQSSDETKQFYAEVANCLLSYKKVNGRISWAYSSFNRGRTKLAKLVIRGKSLNLYLALDPSTVDKKYHVLDVSHVRKYAAVPCRLRIKSARAVKYAKELIAQACGNLDILVNPKFTPTVQAADYPYDTTENLIIAKLIKVNALNGEIIPEEHIVAGGFTLRESVSVDEAHELITDETAATLVENRRTAPVSGKKYIVNIDVLSGNFNAGDVVDIEALKRKKLVPRKEKAIKVLARGVLNKPLIVKANDFSNDAIKMIVLTGGKAIKI